MAILKNMFSIKKIHLSYLLRFGNDYFGENFDQFLWPHSLAIDSNGSIYIAEVSFTEWGRHPLPGGGGFKEMPSLKKWIFKD